MDKRVIEKIKENFLQEILSVESGKDMPVFLIRKESLLGFVKFLKEEPDIKMEQVTDITAVDWYKIREYRFEVIYHFYSYTLNHRLRLRVRIGEDDVKIPSITGIFSGANWFERECYDMYGIIFLNHPDLRRILLYPEFVGHPLRKDYPIDKRQPLVKLRRAEEKRERP
ncbi:MAG: NADH-quinone oxidoreductase subunit C [Deltaproteobacteria bacterium]|nr:NADH-quinone oxidoreductase subunit C [Deltaproteobacteria bacterium]